MKKFFSFFAAMLMAVSMVAAESELLYELTTSEVQGSNNSYAGNCDIEVNNITWNFTGNSQQNPWRIGGKSLAAVEREVYTKTAFPVELDSVCLYLGNNLLTSLDGVKLVYSTNADFSDAEEVIAAVPEKFPATVTFAVEGGFPAKAYYKFVLTCTVSGNSNKYIQFNGVDFWGVMPVVAVTNPVFSVAAGSYYDAQTVELSCETDGAEIRYTLDGTEPTATSALYSEALTISETTTVKAIAIKGADQSEVVEKTYTIAKQYASLTALVNEAGAPAGQKVVVTLTNEKIDSLYANKSGNVNGIYLTAAGRMVEIYCYDVPKTWAVGGTVSGIVKGDWKEYNGTWEVCPSSWDGIEYTAPAAEWDGTVTLSKTTINSIADLEGITLTFNGATTVEFLGADADILALQNKNGSELYAAWHPEYGGSYTIAGNVVTLTGWFDNTETAPLPQGNATLYVEDYGAFKIDGNASFFETAEVDFEAAPATTYTVTYTVSGAVAEETSAQAGYFNESTTAVEFLIGANTVPENMIAYVSVSMLEGHTCEVKVNGTAVTLGYGNYWQGAIEADMTIEVIFDGGDKTVEEVLKYSKFVRDDATATSYTNFTYESASGATYKAHMMYQATDDKIQLRSTQTASTYYSGIVNTVAPNKMYIKSVSVEWEAATADARQLNIFTVDAPIAINDMFAQGATPNYTTLKSAGDKKIDVEGKHSYIGICSQAGAMYIKSITIEWAESGAPTALQNVEAVKVVKTIENGQLIIIRDGVRYNVVGAKF